MNIIKLYKSKLVKGLILLFMILMLLSPGASFRGASSGLLLWFHNVLPNLLPFIILSNLMVHLDITMKVSKVFYPILGRIFHISCEGCYPILFGFLSGIPMGAKATADLLNENRISIREAQFLLGMCNNASPMFIIGYIAITQLKLPHTKYAIFAIIYGSAIISALIWRLFSSIMFKNKAVDIIKIRSNSNNKTNSRFSFELLDTSIMNGFEIITRIGGYIILFSILAQILKEIGAESGIFKALTMGLLEITTGISQVCMLDITANVKIVLITALTSFGGLSGIAQTKSVLQDSRLSISSYVIVKLLSAFIAIILSIIYVLILNI